MNSDIDMEALDCWLLFKYDDKMIKELDYYTEEKDFRHCTGRYIDCKENQYFFSTYA